MSQATKKGMTEQIGSEESGWWGRQEGGERKRRERHRIGQREGQNEVKARIRDRD
jgi:hypothetical protein